MADPTLHLSGPMPPATPGQRLRYARRLAGLTMGDLARACDLYVHQLSDLELDRLPDLDGELLSAAFLVLVQHATGADHG